jgi:predicted small secreted protein
MLKKILLIILLALFLLVMSNCQTVQGFGRDIEWTSQKSAELLEGM